MRHFVRKMEWANGYPAGWGNGYVVIPKDHPLHREHYDDIDVDVHGGLTFSEPANKLNWPELTDADKDGWVVGFDTAHYDDNILRWPEENVEAETIRLKEQLN